MKPTFDSIFEVFVDNFSVLLLFILIPLLYFSNSFLSILYSCLWFASFDYLMFNSVGKELLSITKYRIVQASIKISIVFLLYHIGGYVYPIWFLFLWWMGFCDLLYYAVGLEKGIIGYKNITWLQWTPYGFIYNIFGKELNSGTFIFYSLLSFVSYLFLLW